MFVTLNQIVSNWRWHTLRQSSTRIIFSIHYEPNTWARRNHVAVKKLVHGTQGTLSLWSVLPAGEILMRLLPVVFCRNYWAGHRMRPTVLTQPSTTTRQTPQTNRSAAAQLPWDSVTRRLWPVCLPDTSSIIIVYLVQRSIIKKNEHES